ncbi:hypothetical protein KAZ66_01080 [Candidatus Woesebacteria bacterium]|nr:hypothetical protein [Candidatus Woesebacteria bacterium]
MKVRILILLILVTFLLFISIPSTKAVEYGYYDDPGQKQGTLFFPTYTPTPIAPTSTPFIYPTELPTATPLIPISQSYTPPTATTIPFYSDSPTPVSVYTPPAPTACPSMIATYTWQGISIGYALVPNTGGNYAWYYLSSTSDFNEFQANIEKIFSNFDQAANNDSTIIRDRADSTWMYKEYSPSGCTRFTAISPTLFIYGKLGNTYDISINKNIVYADPIQSNNKWQVKITEPGLDINGYLRPYLYYEYEATHFVRPIKGWNISKTNIQAFSTSLATTIGLNNTEANRLQFEIAHAAKNIQKDKFFIGLISTEEIKNNLPLTTVPSIATNYRLHFYVGNVTGEVTHPSVTPILRTSEMIIELGAAGYND